MTPTRTLILDAAAQLFSERGYAAVSMRDVAKAVGVTASNLYYHFQDKNELITAALHQVFAPRAILLNAAMEANLDDPLRGLVRQLVLLLSDDVMFSRLLHRELLDGDADRIASLCEAIFLTPFLKFAEILAHQYGGRDPRKLALSAIALILGQILILPLTPILAGDGAEARGPDAIVAEVLSMLRSPANG
jgi:AcrR family transcriptional regulator